MIKIPPSDREYIYLQDDAYWERNLGRHQANRRKVKDYRAKTYIEYLFKDWLDAEESYSDAKRQYWNNCGAVGHIRHAHAFRTKLDNAPMINYRKALSHVPALVNKLPPEMWEVIFKSIETVITVPWLWEHQTEYHLPPNCYPDVDTYCLYDEEYEEI